jgi:cyanobactin maturation PatA/PatG family protease
LLCDTTGDVCRAYGACTEPPTTSAQRNTYIVAPDGAIMAVWENVAPEDQGELVVGFLREQARPQMDERGDHRDDRLVGDAVALAVPDAQPPPEQAREVLPSQAPATFQPQLVFALGRLGYDLVSEARRDSLAQHMEGDPGDPRALLAYLEKYPSEAASVTWTLNLDDALPIYALEPDGTFASSVYERLRQFLDQQLTEGVERISAPGVVAGEARLLSGQVVPVIRPELRCMYSWTTAALVRELAGEEPAKSAAKAEHAAFAEKTAAVTNFLERVYHELRNLGVMSQDRAINYAVTNALNVERIFEASLRDEMQLDSISVEPSPVCRPESDCWDVKLTFFNPNRILEQARRVYRFTVDVSDVCPLMVGAVRSWSIR